MGTPKEGEVFLQEDLRARPVVLVVGGLIPHPWSKGVQDPTWGHTSVTYLEYSGTQDHTWGTHLVAPGNSQYGVGTFQYGPETFWYRTGTSHYGPRTPVSLQNLPIWAWHIPSISVGPQTHRGVPQESPMSSGVPTPLHG